MSVKGLFWGLSVCVFLMIGGPERTVAQNQNAGTDTSEVGYLAIDVAPRVDSLYVVVDRDFDSPHYVANGDSIGLTEGEKRITIVSEKSPDFWVRVEIQPGTTRVVDRPLPQATDRAAYLDESSFPVFKKGINLLIVTDRDSRILVDSVAQGTGIARMNVSAGKHLVETVNSQAGRTERVVTVQAAPPRLERVVMYNKPSRSMVKSRSVAPGLAQLHKDHRVRGIAFLAGFGLSTLGAVQQHFVFHDRSQKYRDKRKKYQSATTEEEAFRLGNETEELNNEARGAYRRRNALIGAAAGIYLYSLLDAWFNRPDGGYRTPLSRRTRLDPLLGTRRQGFRLVLRF